MYAPKEEADWEITSEGLYIATRGFLIRRGYCCANRCRHCPYINWRYRQEWEPAPERSLRRVQVSPKVLIGVRTLLAHHEQQLRQCPPEDQPYHKKMVDHYHRLLNYWGYS